MALKPDAEYPGKTVPGNAAYPQGSAQNVTTPGDGTGTPWEEALVNDIWGVLQKLLDVATIVPSGNPDTVLASDYFDSLVRTFQRFGTHNDTGSASNYVLASALGSTLDAYYDGHQILFKATNSNPAGASLVDVDGIGNVALELPGGVALPADSIISGQYIYAVYRATGTRYEVLNAASGVPFDDSTVGYTALTVQVALQEVVKRANHTGTQLIATLSDHNKAAHDALGIAAATATLAATATNALSLGGSLAALFAKLASPAFTGNPTAPTHAPADNSTKLATTAYADAAAGAASSIGQAALKTTTGAVSTAVTANLTLPGGEYGFYPQVKTAGAGDDVSHGISSVFANVAYVTNIRIGIVGGTGFAQQRYVQASPPYKIGDIQWGHFVYQLRNKSTGEVVCAYEAQDPPWAYNGPNWLGKDDPELLALIPHPFPDFGTERFPESDFEVVLVDLRDFDVNLWLYDNVGRGKTIITDLADFATVGNIRSRSQVGLPEIPGFTDKVKIRARN